MQRRLAAILAADMVGYSRLMGADEEGTITRLRAIRESIIDPMIADNGGRMVKTTGDGLLVEFASAVDAFKCGAAIQSAIARSESEQALDSRIRFRMGINVGDVVAEGDDLLGDGVNIAARLEGIAEPSGICLSDFAFQSVKGRVDESFIELGRQNLKNIEQAVTAWKWQNDEPPLQSPKATEGASKPSIAVLPFDNMSGDQEQAYFADGMAEDLITELSRMPWFYVLARNTAFTYKGRAVDIRAVGQELGVAYILEGSVRKAGNRIRVTAQLIDTATANHVWAERYDRELRDIFDIQDEITQAIISAIAPEFISAEIKKSRQKDFSQLNAWECVMRGRAHVLKFGKNDKEIAKQLFEQAIASSPDGTMGLADLALVHFLDGFYRWSESPTESWRIMEETAKKAVAADDNDPLALTILAWTLLMNRRWDDAIETVDRAIALSPNFSPAIGIRGAIYACNDEPDIAVPAILEAMERSPRDAFLPFWYMCLYWSYHSQRDYEKGLDCAKNAVRIAPDNPTFIRQLAAAYWMLGDKERSREAVETYLRLLPNATVHDVRNIPARNPQTIEDYVEIMRAMGVPEGDTSKEEN